MDAISQLVNKLKNAARAKRARITLPHSTFAAATLAGLKRTGYLSTVSTRGEKHLRSLEAELAYENGAPRFTEVKRVSKPSRRLYTGAHDVRRVHNGYGRLFLTTSKGIMTDSEARKAHIGGEPLFIIW